MLRRLLAERFGLKVEDSARDQRVWALVAAPGGPKLKPRDATQPCPHSISSADMKAAGAPPSAMSGFNGCTIADLVAAFNWPGNSAQLGRPVVDQTGIAGSYHMLVWQAFEKDDSDNGRGVRFSYREPFREAVEKELGLKLVDAHQVMHYVNVLSVSRPNAN